MSNPWTPGTAYYHNYEIQLDYAKCCYNCKHWRGDLDTDTPRCLLWEEEGPWPIQVCKLFEGKHEKPSWLKEA